MSKGRWILALGGLATGLIVVVGWLMFRDTTTCVAARVARAHSTVRLDHARGVPGAYRHRPGGFEEVDALSGGRHEYPAETFMTIALSECGSVVRWSGDSVGCSRRALDLLEHCGSNLAVTASSTCHEWFGVANLEEEICAELRLIAGVAGEW